MKRLHSVGLRLRAPSALRLPRGAGPHLRALTARPATAVPKRTLTTGTPVSAAAKPTASSSPAAASSSSGSSDGSSSGSSSSSTAPTGSYESYRHAIAGVCGAMGLALSWVVIEAARSEQKDKPTAGNGKPQDSKTLKPKKRPTLYVPPADDAPISLFAGSGNPALAAEVAMALGIQLGRATVAKFRDGETNVQVHDSVRGRDVFIIQSICGPNPNDRLMELLLMVTAMRRASANRITVVAPYFAYARQANSGMSEQGTIAAADVALMLEVSGVDQVVTIDVHRPQLQGFFSDKTPVELLDPIKTVAPYFAHRMLARPVIASPVSGGHGVHRATHFQHHLSMHGVDAPLALLYVHDKEGFVDPDAVHHRQILDKKPLPSAAPLPTAPAPAPGSPAVPIPTAAEAAVKADAKAAIMEAAGAADTAAALAASSVVTTAAAGADKEYVEVVGDVSGRDVIVVDDMVDTGSRVCSAATALKKAGAKRVFVYATHGLFTGDAIERINSSELFEIVCFNTVPLGPEKWSVRIRQLSCSALLAECIRRLNSNDTLQPLFH